MAGKIPLFIGTDISAALVGVGYIIGPNIASLMFLGGFIGFGVVLPLLGLLAPPSEPLIDWFFSMWSEKIRYMGVGTMALGGLWSIYSIRHAISKALKELFSSQKRNTATAQDLSPFLLFLLMSLSILLIFFLYEASTHNIWVSLVSTFVMVLLAFFFVAVASYICGLVGSSSSPVSGMTICALLIAGGLLALIGYQGIQGTLATLIIAGVVCCATATSGDIAQDLKTGYLIGAIPKKQQIGEILGVFFPSFFLAPVLMILHRSYGIGTQGPNSLQAPQASLFAQLTQTLMGRGTLPWGWISLGLATAAIIIFLDEIQKKRKASFRLPVMAVGVGLYLPVTISVPILMGGILSLLARKKASSSLDTGVLFSSGLIAGESLTGILIGGALLISSHLFPLTSHSSSLLSLLLLFLIGGLLLKEALKKREPNSQA